MVKSNYAAICPICGKKTAFRIQDSGNLNEYPIRVNCMNCRALLKGTYIMAEHSSFQGLHLDNAEVVEKMGDNNTWLPKEVDYIAEVSGELPCNLVRKNDGVYKDTPFMVAASHLPDATKMIDRVSHFRSDIEKWRKQKTIVFQLLEEGSLEYLPIAIKKVDSSTNNDTVFHSFQSIQALAVEELTFLFPGDNPHAVIKELLEPLSTVNQESILPLIDRVGGTKELIACFRKMMDVVADFMLIYPNVLPAEIYMHFFRLHDAPRGLATCSYGDLKTFYQDSYESIGSLLHIPVCLDNILVRGDYLSFSENVSRKITKIDPKKGEKDSFDSYLNKGKGNKYLWLEISEPIQSALSLPNNSSVRNGIGHNLFVYDPLQQVLVFDGYKNGKASRTELTLMEMAIECCELVQTATIIAELVLFLLRRLEREEGIVFPTYLRFYDNLRPNDKCPCCSGKKYKKCCWNEIQK